MGFSHQRHVSTEAQSGQTKLSVMYFKSLVAALGSPAVLAPTSVSLFYLLFAQPIYTSISIYFLYITTYCDVILIYIADVSCARWE